jgi:hypothetical protein
LDHLPPQDSFIKNKRVRRRIWPEFGLMAVVMSRRFLTIAPQ